MGQVTSSEKHSAQMKCHGRQIQLRHWGGSKESCGARDGTRAPSKISTGRCRWRMHTRLPHLSSLSFLFWKMQIIPPTFCLLLWGLNGIMQGKHLPRCLVLGRQEEAIDRQRQLLTIMLTIKSQWVAPFCNGIIFSFPVTHLQGLAQGLGCPRLLGRLELPNSAK